jgi:outer membrane lipoprotein carrier protein
MDLTHFLLGLILGTANQAAPAKAPASTPAKAPAPAPAKVGTAPAPAAAPAASTAGATALVDEVQAFYRRTGQLSAKFRQTVKNEVFGRTTVSSGRVYIKKPGKMRWDYFSKRDKSKVTRSQMSDGKMIWAVDVNGKWYYKQDLTKSTLPVAVTFLTGKGDLAREFNSKLLTGSKHGSASDKVLELTPRKPSAQFKTLVLVIDPATFRVKKSIVTTATGDTNEFSFYEPDTTKMVADTWFVFNPKGPTTKGFREIKAEEAPQK